MMQLGSVVVTWALLSGLTLAQSVSVATKQVAAPAEDLISGRLRLPDPAATGTLSGHALLPIEFASNGQWQTDFPVPSSEGLSLAIVAEDPRQWSLRLNRPGQQDLDLRASQSVSLHHNVGHVPLFVAEPRAERFDFVAPEPAQWTLRIDAPTNAVSQEQGLDGWLVLRDRAPWQLHTYPLSFGLHAGGAVTLRSLLLDPAAAASPLSVVSARSVVTTRGPLGQRTEVERQHGRGEGLWEFVLPLPIAGDYSVHFRVDATLSDGTKVLRSSETLWTAVIPQFGFAASPGQSSWHEERLRIRIPLQGSWSSEHLLVAAEVWGQDRRGERVPVCFLARMQQCREDDEGLFAELFLERDWLHYTSVRSGLELRSLRLHDPDSMVLLDLLDWLPLSADVVSAAGSDSRIITTPTQRMLMGRLDDSIDVPPRFSQQGSSAVAAHAAALVHGYCSGGNPYPTGHFSGALAEFSDPNANRSHDAFAILLAQQGAVAKSFGVVAHSQGGLASLHLYTYYYSALDWASGNRLIQSVGSPYQGTPLAGDAAVLGEIFGVGCGTNFCLTESGAALWLSAIPTWARQEVHYWTTSFTDNFFFYDYCNLVSDLFLTDPDDGVVEAHRGDLPGGNDHGHREGWCHTVGMRDPAQTTDASRNSEMNQQAQR